MLSAAPAAQARMTAPRPDARRTAIRCRYPALPTIPAHTWSDQSKVTVALSTLLWPGQYLGQRMQGGTEGVTGGSG